MSIPLLDDSSPDIVYICEFFSVFELTVEVITMEMTVVISLRCYDVRTQELQNQWLIWNRRISNYAWEKCGPPGIQIAFGPESGGASGCRQRMGVISANNSRTLIIWEEYGPHTECHFCEITVNVVNGCSNDTRRPIDWDINMRLPWH